jgi:hypothetical protein
VKKEEFASGSGKKDRKNVKIAFFIKKMVHALAYMRKKL